MKRCLLILNLKRTVFKTFKKQSLQRRTLPPEMKVCALRARLLSKEKKRIEEDSSWIGLQGKPDRR